MFGLFENESVKNRIIDILTEEDDWMTLKDLSMQLTILESICLKDSLRALIRERRITQSREQGFVIFNGARTYRLAKKRPDYADLDQHGLDHGISIEGKIFHSTCNSQLYAEEVAKNVGGEVRPYGIKIKKRDPISRLAIDWEKTTGFSIWI